MRLTILSPTSSITHEVEWVECNTPTGNYVIQEGHAPTILALSPQKHFIYALKDGKQEVVMIEWGMLHVTRQEVALLLDKNSF